MTASIHAAFDFAELGTFTVSFTDSGGTAAIPLTTGKYSAVNIATVASTISSFPAKLQTDLNANATLVGVYAVSFSTTTLKYTISANITFSMTFTLPSVASRVLGFTSNKSGANTYTSDVRAYYSILFAYGGVSGPTDDYEPSGYAEDAYTEGGDHFGVRSGVMPAFYDFSAPLETKAASFKRAAVSTAPWTFQHFFEHVRNVQTFALVTDVETSVHRLRAQASQWAPQRVAQDYDDLWTIPFQTALRGRV